MKNIVEYSLLILIILFVGCTKNKNELTVDEVYISMHNVAPPLLKSITKFIPPGSKTKVDSQIVLTEWEKLWLKSIPISKSSYIPRLIIKVNRNGEALGYIRNLFKLKEGNFKIMLPESLIKYFNSQIQIMNYTRLDTLYYDDNDEMIYDGPEYFISIKNKDKVKQFFILNKYKGPRNIIKFVDSLYNYIDTIKLLNSINNNYRKDTLIVLKTEKYQDWIWKRRVKE